MGKKKSAENRITILVNSCDSYSDLWIPFFTLLKKYWDPKHTIILNTETQNFHFPGLNIHCVHTRKEAPYGERMLNVLKEVKTEYVLLLLDDFFLRSRVYSPRIFSILEWMDADKEIVCFNCDPNQCYEEWEVNRYPGFRRIPPGNGYTLSLQAAIWRTKALKKYWRPNITPWEWEVLSSTMTTKYPKDKFYCLNSADDAFLNYGHRAYGDVWGVYRGKWVVDDVGPLFEKENIKTDFSLRGTCGRDERTEAISWDESRKERYCRIYRCLGLFDTLIYFVFCRYNNILHKFGKDVSYDYFHFLCEHAKTKHLKTEHR